MSTAYTLGEKPLHDYLREHARRQPTKAAYLWYGRALSYGELDRLSDAFAARLAALGVVKAFLVLRADMQANAEEIIAWARENMSAYKAPTYVEFRDMLPATGAGKVLRRLLKDAP